MGLIDRFFLTSINRRVDEIAQRRAVIMHRVTEARGKPDRDEYAFRHLRGGQGQRDLPEAFVAQILRDSHWMYESHGLAERILERVVTIILEGGIEYSVSFLPSFEERYPEYAKVIRARLDDFWFSEDADMVNRAAEALLELLLSGEHGWRFGVDPSTGTVHVGDFTRFEVKDIEVEAFDRRRLAAVSVQYEPGAEEEILRAITIDREPQSPGFGHLAGDCVYMRLRTRTSKLRGRPLLQGVIDELKSEKKFRVLSTDRSIVRMSSFLDVEIEGATEEDIDRTREKYGTGLPSNGTIFYHNEKLQANFKSANIEAAELANMYRTGITIIAGFLGMPISWFGYGDGSTKATSETQQGPAELDYKSMRVTFLGHIEKVLRYVVDQALVHRYVTGGVANLRVEVEDEDSRAVQKWIRDCVTITVSTRPLAEEKPKTTPLAATTAVMDIISKDDLRAQATGVKLFPPETEIELVNFALGTDGTGVEVVYEPTAEPAASPDMDLEV